MRSRNADFPSHQVLPEPSVTEKVNGFAPKMTIFQISNSRFCQRCSLRVLFWFFFFFLLQIIKRPHSKSGPPCLEDLMAKKEKQVDRAAKPSTNQFVIDIINSTPELAHFNGCVNARY